MIKEIMTAFLTLILAWLTMESCSLFWEIASNAYRDKNWGKFIFHVVLILWSGYFIYRLLSPYLPQLGAPSF